MQIAFSSQLVTMDRDAASGVDGVAIIRITLLAGLLPGFVP
jgi:hypothetical protein